MKKSVTRSISLSLLLVSIMSVLCIGASAAEEEISPRYTGIHLLNANINITASGRADCYGYVNIQDGYSVDLTVALQRDGQTIKSWSDSGTKEVSMTKSYYVSKGHDYQVVVSANVYNSQGKLVDTPDIRSAVASY